MKLSTLLLLPVTLALAEVYPQTKQSKAPTVIPFANEEQIPISCITRQIDNGEHKFDEDNNIIYEQFPVCQETGEHLKFQYGVSQNFNCTITLTDEVYHLFQLYIHQDVPFSCRLPFSKNKDAVFIPLTLNFRGIIETSHLDIDTSMNVLIHKGAEPGSIISSIGYSASGNVSRYIIGDSMPIRFHVDWFDAYHKTVDDPHRYDVKLGFDNKMVLVISVLSSVVVGVVVFVSLYGMLNKKILKDLGFKPGFTTELGIDKRD